MLWAIVGIKVRSFFAPFPAGEYVSGRTSIGGFQFSEDLQKATLFAGEQQAIAAIRERNRKVNEYARNAVTDGDRFALVPIENAGVKAAI